eukprot:gnl/TRDRNA2_/TRDRNA2_37623_c0_seq1.p1 gnl/TRDRNA2_/TRDRNA2_37623_c0~~gnl/TRDRNA2_/TRDRNA2_37623_c0_seq1.p1  ORF type:complete len:499 (-),score=79.10 gnl/TRDRNA2_/TRDRNA2_37623_c0_seq1:210-1706(-)
MDCHNTEAGLMNSADDGTHTRTELGGELRSKSARTLVDVSDDGIVRHTSDVLPEQPRRSKSVRFRDFSVDEDTLGVIPHCRSLRVVTGDEPASETKIVMNKYIVDMTSEGIIGEGTSSICRKGKIIQTGEDVAVKVYKDRSDKAADKHKDVTLQKFKRQVEVLEELQTPFVRPSDETLWHEQLELLQPSRIFMSLVDYSKDQHGQPGPDTSDGVLYIVTEVAQYSLKDFFAHMRAKRKPIPNETVKSIAHAIVLVVAGLHAKGLVHLDLKPENLMVFPNDRLKLIDVDGCVKIGTSLSVHDSTISFSPCYCAPEWGRFLLNREKDPRMVVSPGLDVWSIGMTLCELVNMEPVTRATYASFGRSAKSSREGSCRFIQWLAHGGFRFADWLKDTNTGSLVPEESWDPDLIDMLGRCLLVNDVRARNNLAECLSHPYFAPTCPQMQDADIQVHLSADERLGPDPRRANRCWTFFGIRPPQHKMLMNVDRIARSFRMSACGA